MKGLPLQSISRNWPLLACAALLLVQSRAAEVLPSFDIYWIPSPRSAVLKHSPDLARAMALGQSSALIDWLFVKFLTDSETHKVLNRERATVFWDLLLASELDPKFFELYYYGANILTIVRDDNEGARLLLDGGERFRTKQLPALGPEFGEKFWPNQVGFLITRAYVEIFEMDNLPGGLDAFREIAKLSNPPSYVGRLLARADTPEGQLGIGIQLLKFLIESQGKEPAAREKLERRLKSLQVIQHLYGINQQFQDALAKRPEYRGRSKIAPKEMQRFFERFAREQKLNLHDPFGGEIRLDPETGKITTSTPHEKTLGLFY